MIQVKTILTYLHYLIIFIIVLKPQNINDLTHLLYCRLILNYAVCCMVTGLHIKIDDYLFIHKFLQTL